MEALEHGPITIAATSKRLFNFRRLMVFGIPFCSTLSHIAPMSHFTHDTPMVRHPELVAAEMDGDLVMMSIERGEYYGVGGVGPRVWELLEEPISIDGLTATICSEFEVEEARCREDVTQFVTQMSEMGLIQIARA